MRDKIIEALNQQRHVTYNNCMVCAIHWDVTGLIYQLFVDDIMIDCYNPVARSYALIRDMSRITPLENWIIEEA